MTAPTSALSGRITAVTATTFTVQLDKFPSTNITGWRIVYRKKVEHGEAPNTWTDSSTNNTVAAGQTIQVTGLTEGAMYQAAFQGLNNAEEGDLGQFFTVVPTGGKNTFDGSELTETLMDLINDNLTAAARLGLTRNANYGTLDDYPNIRDQSGLLPMVLVQPLGVAYSWAEYPRGFNIEYRYRILFVREYNSTQDVVRLRNDALGELVGLFSDFRQLGVSGGVLSQGKIAYAIVEAADVRPAEDTFRMHDSIFVVGLTLMVKVRARA